MFCSHIFCHLFSRAACNKMGLESDVHSDVFTVLMFGYLNFVQNYVNTHLFLQGKIIGRSVKKSKL
jgi:hypothetical protein